MASSSDTLPLLPNGVERSNWKPPREGRGQHRPADRPDESEGRNSLLEIANQQRISWWSGAVAGAIAKRLFQAGPQRWEGFYHRWFLRRVIVWSPDTQLHLGGNAPVELVCALTYGCCKDIALCNSTGSNSAVAPIVACVAFTFTKSTTLYGVGGGEWGSLHTSAVIRISDQIRGPILPTMDT